VKILPRPHKPIIDRTARSLCCTALSFAALFTAAAQTSFIDSEPDNIRAFLHDNFRQTNACIVIGLADQRGNKIFSAGKLDNGTDGDVNGDTVFFIGSVSKTFTTLLLQDAVERGEMKLDDPVAKYLHSSIKMPNSWRQGNYFARPGDAHSRISDQPGQYDGR